ncbi:MAG TPA: GDP-mannose 4,6-dehydratase [Actinomycetota bacterium]|nr:GDP-mannose 4,6-dehydratase [Actinomycetota bacterium]
MRILVTGAGGFVGHHLLPELAGAGHEVVAVSHVPWTPPIPVATGVFDIRDPVRVAAVVAEHAPEGVIHLAALASPQKSWDAAQETFEVNVIGTSHLLGALASRPGTRFLVVGSAQEYGAAHLDRPLLETDPLRPASPYAVSKVAQELLAFAYGERHGLPVVVARSFNHTGPGQTTDYAVGAFAAQVAAIERGDQPPRMTVGWLESRRDFLDVRDVCRAYRLLVEAGEPGEVYNVASGRAERIGDLLAILLEAAGLSGVVEVHSAAAPRPGDPATLLGDATKLRQGLGWEPEIPMATSVADTLDSHRDPGGPSGRRPAPETTRRAM